MAWELLMFAGIGTAMLAGCLVPNSWLPPLPNDKLMHFGGFAVLTALALRLATDRAESLLWLAGLLLAGYLVECLQAFVPERSFCWRDMAANAAGVASAATAAALLA